MVILAGLEAFLELLGAILAPLGVILAPLGAILAPLGVILGPLGWKSGPGSSGSRIFRGPPERRTGSARAQGARS